jgi:hypothetical protein
MSSLSGTSSHRNEPLVVDYQGQGRYVMNGREANEAQVNQALQNRGVTAASGNFRTSDGFSLQSSNSHAVSFTGDAPLPEVSGQVAGGELVGQRAQWAASMSDGALMWNALWTLAQTAIVDMKSSKELKNAMEEQKIQTKQTQINVTEQQIAAERRAANEQLCFAVAAAVVSFATAGMSGSASPGGNGEFSMSSALSSSAYSLGNVVSQAGNAYSKNMGAQREADDKRVQVKRLEREEAIIDQSIDSAKSNYEESRELFKTALKIISEHAERNTQVSQKITS